MSEQHSPEQRKPEQGVWSDVDRAEDTAAYTAYLDTVRTMNATSVYKRRSIELLGLEPGMRALDVGCGTGEESAALAGIVGPEGQVLGIDFSAAMVGESQARWASLAPRLRFEVGDVHALGLPDRSWDVARADRMFQHLASPAGALGELVRVLRPGGRLVVSDPDWGTYVIDAPPSPAVRRYHEFAQGQARNPWIGRQLYGLFRAAGLRDVAVEAQVVFFLDLNVLEKMGNLDAGFVSAVADGQMTAEQVAEVRSELRARQAAGRFLASLNVVTVSGTVPG